MKIPLTTLFLLGTIRAFGQAQAPAPDVRWALSTAPIYTSLSDTTTVAVYITPGEKLLDLGNARPGWVKVRRANKDYYVAERFLSQAPTPTSSAKPTNVSIYAVAPGAATYAVAKTTSALLKRHARFLMLDEGTKRALTHPFYEDEKGLAVQFETEAAVLSFLDAQGWIIIPNGQELLPEAGIQVQSMKKYEYDNIYILKRKAESAK